MAICDSTNVTISEVFTLWTELKRAASSAKDRAQVTLDRIGESDGNSDFQGELDQAEIDYISAVRDACTTFLTDLPPDPAEV